MLFVSVVIPTYNRSSLVIRAIHSVLNQHYKNFEIIVVDDGSTDDTEIILSDLIEHQKIKYFKQPNLGVSSARNYGVSNASGDWIAFLDSDDEWLPIKLGEQINYLELNPLIQIVYGDEIWIRNGKRVNPKIIHQKFKGWIFDKCIQQCFIAPSSVLLKKEVFLSLDGFDPEFEVCEDYDLWLKISSLHEIGFVSQPLIIKYGGHEDQLSTKFFAMDMWRVRSLYRIFKTKSLRLDHSILVKDLLVQKMSILINGYKKHNNLDAVKELENILNEINIDTEKR